MKWEMEWSEGRERGVVGRQGRGESARGEGGRGVGGNRNRRRDRENCARAKVGS